MKIEPKPSDREVLAGLVERVTFHNEENGFCVPLSEITPKERACGLLAAVVHC